MSDTIQKQHIDKYFQTKLAATRDATKRAEIQKEYDATLASIAKQQQKRDIDSNFKKVSNWFGIKGVFWKLKSYIFIAVLALILTVFFIMRRGVVVT